MTPAPFFYRPFFLCALSALLTCLAFPSFFHKTLEVPFAFLGWVALVPFFLALEGASPRKGGFLGLLFGFLHLGGILYWIALLEEAQYLSGLAWAVLTFYLSFYFALFGMIYRFLRERLKWTGAWLAPFVWTGLEYLRGSRPWGGFNWGEIGYSQAPYPTVLAATCFAGVYGLTFLMVWFNAAVAELIQKGSSVVRLPSSAAPQGRSRPEINRVVWAPRFLLPAALLASVLAWGTYVTRTTPIRKVGTVALLQPSIDQSVKWSKEHERETYDRLGRLVEEAAKAKPDLVVWPETAAPSYLMGSPQALQRVASAVRRSGSPHLVGCLHRDYSPTDRQMTFNAAVPFDAQGKPGGFYGKRHRVPFGEFVPFQDYLTFLGPVVGDLGNFDEGPAYQTFQARGFSYTPLICYEVVFPGDVQKALRAGAETVVNISNDAWYGTTASAYQHAMMGVVRAAEHRKPLLRSSNAGICLATDPLGRILTSTRLFEEKAAFADVLLSDSRPTLYARWGNWLPWFCLGATLVLLAAVFAASKRGASV